METIFADYSEQEIHDQEVAYEQEAAYADFKAEQGYELWLETRYRDQIESEPWWAQ